VKIDDGESDHCDTRTAVAQLCLARDWMGVAAVEEVGLELEVCFEIEIVAGPHLQ
jgi:hypothetical protein